MKNLLSKLKGIGLFAGGFIIGGMIFVETDDEPTITSEAPAAQEVAAEVEAPKEEAPKEEPKVEAPKEIKPVQVYTDDKVTISFKDLTSEGIRFLVENKTNATITIQADSVALNGFSANNIMMSDEISPMSKGYVIARTTELVDAGEPATVSGGLSVIDFGESFDTYGVNFTNVKIK